MTRIEQENEGPGWELEADLDAEDERVNEEQKYAAEAEGDTSRHPGINTIKLILL